jgi:hypothetical protein
MIVGARRAKVVALECVLQTGCDSAARHLVRWDRCDQAEGVPAALLAAAAAPVYTACQLPPELPYELAGPNPKRP